MYIYVYLMMISNDKSGTNDMGFHHYRKSVEALEANNGLSLV